MFESHSGKKEAYFLQVLWSGLERLYSEMKIFEKEEQDELEEGFFHSSFGSGPNDTEITNDFVW